MSYQTGFGLFNSTCHFKLAAASLIHLGVHQSFFYLLAPIKNVKKELNTKIRCVWLYIAIILQKFN